MITVIIAGGSGTRLWPLSTPAYPKHLLNIIGGERSLLQNTYDRVANISSEVYVLTEAGHSHHVKKQLPSLGKHNFIVEPARRGTANCIIAALNHLEGRHDVNEPIAFLAADHHVRDIDGFAHSFRVASQVSYEDRRIVLVGVEPDYPATGFGYIQKGELFNEELFVYNVHSFREKPDHETARNYIKTGNYLWNCSYFVGSIDTFKNNIQKHSPVMFKNYQALLNTKSTKQYEEVYLDFVNDTVDYALIEKVDDLLVVPASFDWMDLGSYRDLHKAVISDERGNYVQGNALELEGVENSFIQNNEDKPVIVIGLDNVVIINTPQGLLVTRKDLSQQVGEISKRFGAPKKT